MASVKLGSFWVVGGIVQSRDTKLIGRITLNLALLLQPPVFLSRLTQAQHGESRTG